MGVYHSFEKMKPQLCFFFFKNLPSLVKIPLDLKEETLNMKGDQRYKGHFAKNDHQKVLLTLNWFQHKKIAY